MGDDTAIEWADATWNVATGCTKVSPGCAYCYISRTPPFRTARRRWVRGDIPLVLHPDRLELPLRWTRPRDIFVNSLSDLWHPDMPDDLRYSMFRTMAHAPQHRFLILTKRPEAMCKEIDLLTHGIVCSGPNDGRYGHAHSWPLPNVWLGITAENQAMLDERWKWLRRTPAAVRWISAEPLLAPLKLPRLGKIDWIVVGGESGGPLERRLVDRAGDPTPQGLQRVRELRDQAGAVGIPFFFKQWGGPLAKSSGRILDGRTWDDKPS